MKITRRQLRKIIINEIRVKPGGDMDPEYVEKITSMIGSGNEEFTKSADELASMVGHDAGDSFSQGLKRYDQVSLMGDIGELIAYLTDEDIQMLMNIRGKTLRYYLRRFGPGFDIVNLSKVHDNPIERSIPSDTLYNMIIRIASKKKNIDDDDFAAHDGMDTGVEAGHKLVQKIISMSRVTYVDKYTIEEAGIAEDRGSRYDFFEPAYEKLYKAGKLVIK